MKIGLRDHLAIEAAKMLWGDGNRGYHSDFPSMLCEEAYRVADGMLEARKCRTSRSRRALS